LSGFGGKSDAGTKNGPAYSAHETPLIRGADCFDYEKSYGGITGQDNLDQANMESSIFYAHYRDIHAIINKYGFIHGIINNKNSSSRPI
jgi:hypothetical protein